MSRAATPMTALYLRTGSPLAMARAATLWPAGTWPRRRAPSSGSVSPRASGTLATSTLSAGCSRIRGDLLMASAAGKGSALLQQFLQLQALDQLRLLLVRGHHVLLVVGAVQVHHRRVDAGGDGLELVAQHGGAEGIAQLLLDLGRQALGRA